MAHTFRLLWLACASAALLGAARGDVLHVALDAAREALAADREPVLLSDAAHSWNDTWRTVDFAGGMAAASALLALEGFGLTREARQELAGAATGAGRRVYLRLQVDRNTTLAKKEAVQVKGPVRETTQESCGSLYCSTETSRVATETTVTEHSWATVVTMALEAYVPMADGAEMVVPLHRTSREDTYRTTTDRPPHAVAHDRHDVSAADVTQLVADPAWPRPINRTDPQCHTAAQNPDTDRVVDVFSRLADFAGSADAMARSAVPHTDEDDVRVHLPRGGGLVFVPVLPLHLQEAGGAPPPAPSSARSWAEALPLFARADAEALLGLQKKTFAKAVAKYRAQAPPSARFLNGSAAGDEAALGLLLQHLKRVARQVVGAKEAVEAATQRKVLAAVGKHLTAEDFEEYMNYHNRRLFAAPYGMKDLSFAVRRGRQSPEGLLTINAGAKPALALSHVQQNFTTTFALNAASSVRLTGRRHVHYHIAHRFAASAGAADLSVSFRAKQFAGYVVVVGTLGGGGGLLPEASLVVMNREGLDIPLILEALPTAREFQDYLAALSPAQQRFARAYRELQLSGSLFAVAVIQIKPLLEQVLNLPPQALNKEIALTQDLLDLFLKYDVSSDLLCYDADVDGADATAAEKVGFVTAHTAAVKAIIAGERAKEEEEAEKKKKKKKKREEEEEEEEEEERANVRMQTHSWGLSGGGINDIRRRIYEKVRRDAESVRRHAESGESYGVALGEGPDDEAPDDEAPDEPRLGEETAAGNGASDAAAESSSDAAALPHRVDAALLEARGAHGRAASTDALRPATIKPAGLWARLVKKSLLSAPVKEDFAGEARKEVHRETFDLLDALTRSGEVEVTDAEVHVLLAATHAFGDTLMNAIVRGNQNPIEEVDASTVLVASVLHGAAPGAILTEKHAARLAQDAPHVLGMKQNS